MKGFLCTENSEVGVLTSREANAASKAHRVMNKRRFWEPKRRSRKGPTDLAMFLSLYTQHVGAVKPQASPHSCQWWRFRDWGSRLWFRMCVLVFSSQRGWRHCRETGCSSLAVPFVEAMGESGLISCSNALHFLAVGSAVGFWSASLEARYTSSCVPGESLGAVWDLSCSLAGTARSRQMYASVTVTSH